jgi:N,N'-diacetyl-8-epilegionaminate cytidylyltransferase
MKKKIFAFIFARKNSKRIKNKNIKTINNKTLLEYSINSAKQIRVIDKIYVSTDSNLMVNIAYKKKVFVIKRPKILCKDDSNELLSWKHAIDFLKMKKEKFDIFVSLPTTSPLRSKKDILKMIKTFKRTNSDLVISVTKTNRIPNYNMVKVGKSARAYLAIDKKRLKLKKEEKIYDMTTVGYVAKTKYIEKTKNLLSGKVTAVEIPRERALDIDDNFDLRLGRLLKKK